MIYSVAELKQILYCCAAEDRARKAGKAPGPQPWLSNLIRRVELDIATSADGSDGGCGSAGLVEKTPISVEEAADLVGCSTRYLRYIAADLDGVKVSGRWVFDSEVVRDYAERRRDGRVAG
ncbi:helix-turn-helix domain-containing protein [Mycobacterium colombiense]|uniref:helix-turn-helix domain-containing protein n=1 Tax=Mycobacterium colombiense TaxID=339268 RepID=UPI0011156EAA|nr:helix-turn-helix domain-containing protein [Mycobacterium colombiense]